MARKKIYYLPGMISLILLPILCILFVQNSHVFLTQNTVDINMYSDVSYENDSIIYENAYKVRPDRNYTDIYLNGNEEEDRIKLNFYQLQMRQMIQDDDTLSGIHIVYTQNAKYWELIETLNICKKEEAKFYSFKDNNFWFFIYYPRPRNIQNEYIEIEPMVLCGNKEYEYHNQNIYRSSNVIDTSHHVIKYYIALVIIFLLLGWFTFRNI